MIIQRAGRLVGVLLILCLGATAGRADEWGCYDPKPGHPTQAEKEAFVANISGLAQRAEQGHGVPAAAIAAMAIHESGYGWTRVALNARNLFGWKFLSTNSAGGRMSWTLECQPPEDKNNKYVVFADYADGFDFVASRLSTSDYYRADWERYQRDNASGVDTVEAVNRWVDGIAEPYNWKPEQYARDLRRFMNNPYQPSDELSEESNLYKLSGRSAESPTATCGASPETKETVRATLTDVGFGHYLDKRCEPVSWAGWEGLPTQKCSYAEEHVPGGIPVILLNPTQEQLVGWIASACKAAGATDYAYCGRKLAARINEQSGAQFPVAGIVMEDMGDGMQQFAFRDGVTVSVPGVSNGKKGYPTHEEIEAALQQDPTDAKKYARIQGTTREEYDAYMRNVKKTEPSPVNGLNWAKVIRDEYQQAYRSDCYLLMDAWAVANKSALSR